jgi:hypothetical protein
MVHLIDEEGRKQNGAHRREKSDSLSDFEDGLGIQTQTPKTDTTHLDLQGTLPRVCVRLTMYPATLGTQRRKTKYT